MRRIKWERILLSMLLCVAMICCLTACSGKKNEKPDGTTEEPTTEEPTTELQLETDGVLNLAINVMYNDSDSEYYGNEIGEYVAVTGDGQYTLTFEFDKHISDAAKRAGVRGINKLTSIYIKDYAVTNGLLTASNIVSCDIKYDKIMVDDKEMTITITEPKNAIKDSGIFDTNDPFNSWDGSAVAEVTIDSEAHVLTINDIDNPKKVTITFTLSNLVFAE